MALAGVGQHFSRNFDQYTIMCVFGSVVGCVVLPLMAQSFESLIITAILFGVTVKTLKKSGNGANPRDVQAEERKKDKKNKKIVNKRPILQNAVDGETLRQQRELDLIRRDEIREMEKEQRTEEKRKKKAKKRQEKLQQREEERIEKEKQEEVLMQIRKERDARKRNKQFSSTSDLPLAHMDMKPLRRERQHSTSSSASSNSTYSGPGSAPSHPPTTHKRRPPPRQPKRASSAPLMSATPPPAVSTNQNSPVSNSTCSTPSSYRNHTPLQVFQVLPVLPFISPQMPHPHFLYGSSSSTQQEPRPPHPQAYHYPPYNHWCVQQASSNVSRGDPPYQLAQADRSSGHGSAESAHSASDHGNMALSSRSIAESAHSVMVKLDPQSHGNNSTNPPLLGGSGGLANPPLLGGSGLVNPPLLGGSGPARGFYSFLNDQASCPLPSSPNNIWTPPTTSSQDESKGEWPDWFSNPTAAQ